MSHMLYLQRHIFPEELSMLSIGGALVKAIEMSQNTHSLNNKEQRSRIPVLSSFQTELIKILRQNRYSLEKTV